MQNNSHVASVTKLTENVFSVYTYIYSVYTSMQCDDVASCAPVYKRRQQLLCLQEATCLSVVFEESIEGKQSNTVAVFFHACVS